MPGSAPTLASQAAELATAAQEHTKQTADHQATRLSQAVHESAALGRQALDSLAESSKALKQAVEQAAEYQTAKVSQAIHGAAEGGGHKLVEELRLTRKAVEDLQASLEESVSFTR